MDSKIFTQSKNLMYKAVYYYYLQGDSQKMIADKLNVSVSTVSRLLSRAEELEVVKISILPDVETTVSLETRLKEVLGIHEVIVAPSDSTNPLDRRLSVALEGARHLQKIISDGDVIGMCHGGTIHHLIQYLNPCRKVHTTFLIMHGILPVQTYQQEMEENLAAISNVFGGKKHLLDFDAYIPDGSAYEYAMSRQNTAFMQALFKKIDISVSGIGALYPECDSALRNPAVTGYPMVADFVKERKPCGDILLRFFDENGLECTIGSGFHIMSIDMDDYRKIPTKMIVAAGIKKARACIAAVRGGLVDVLVIDRPLANEILSILDD